MVYWLIVGGGLGNMTDNILDDNNRRCKKSGIKKIIYRKTEGGKE